MKKSIVFLIAAVLLILNVVGFIYLKSQIEKTVVIDVIKVVNEFKLKKDLEEKVESKLHDYTSRLDSLKALVEYSIQQNDKERIDAVTEKFYQLQQEAQNAYEISNKNINEQVWKRLNPLIDEFGAKKKYKVIIGANGMGSVLYKDGTVDKTEELLEYINTRYEKGG